ncbi:MAG: tetracycline resistance MFS efflux pump, partial [Rhizobiales bacterium]|nr:tetracycline resistance MFS efflux pump [Hyphomicrobiales bacterium]
AFLPGPASRLLGERGAVLAGIAAACPALALLAFASAGWMVFAIMPLVALSGIGAPSLQALATRQVDADRQGQLQGVLASAMSLASIVAPLGFSTFYFVVRDQWPGAIWLSVVAVYAVALPLVLLGTRATRPAAPA